MAITPPTFFVGVTHTEGVEIDVSSNMLDMQFSRELYGIMNRAPSGRGLFKVSNENGEMDFGYASNYVKYSNQSSRRAEWGSRGVADNAIIAPDGTQTAAIISDLSDAIEGGISTVNSDKCVASSGQLYTASIYVKLDSTPTTSRFSTYRAGFLTDVNDTLGITSVHIDTTNGSYSVSSIANATFTVVSIGVLGNQPGGYVRPYVTMKSASNSLGYAYCIFLPAYGTAATIATAAYDVTTVGSAAVWGLQINSGSLGRYISTDTSSAPAAAYPLLGCPIRVTATYSETTYPMFKGYIQHIKHDSEFGRRVTSWDAYDLTEKLDSTKITTPLYTQTQVNSIVSVIASLSNVFTTASIDNISDPIPFYWADNKSALHALKEIADYGHHYIHINPSGTLKFTDRNSFITISAVNSYASFYGLETTYDDTSLLNNITLTGQARKQAAAVATVAWIVAPVTVAGSSTSEFWLSYVDPANPNERAPAVSMVTPTASSDYRLSSTASGTLYDYSATTSVGVTFFGESAKCRVFNGQGNTGYVTKFQLSGYSIQKTPAVRQTTTVNSSIMFYGEKRFSLNSDFFFDSVYAQSYTDFLAAMYGTPQPRFTLGLPKNDWPNILSIDLGDMIYASNSLRGVNSSYLIMGMTHTVTLERGLEHLLELNLDVLRLGNILVLDHSVYDLMDTGRIVGF